VTPVVKFTNIFGQLFHTMSYVSSIKCTLDLYFFSKRNWQKSWWMTMMMVKLTKT
jgi:hypothetical protein